MPFFPRIRPFYLLLFWAALSLQCAREVFIDVPEEEPRIVVVSHFTTDRPFEVEVSISQPLYASEETIIPEVVDISISRGGQFLDKLRRAYSEDDRLYWESRDTAQVGVPYALVVRIPGYPAVQASSAVPEHARLQPIVLSPQDLRVEPLDDGRMALRVPLTLEIAAMPEVNQFFAFSLRHETEVFQWVNGQQVPDYYYEDDAFFLADGRTLSLLHNIPEPVVLINEKFWSDNRRTLFVDALIPFDPETERPVHLYVEWRTLSEEFYRYHLSLARQGNNLPLSDPDAVFNNVEGGYGNFSGYSYSIDTLSLPF